MTTTTTPITFTAAVEVIEDRRIIRLAQDASDQLPSRGQVAVLATLGEHEARIVVEPDGRKGHWIAVTDDLAAAARIDSGDDVAVALEPTKEWPETKVPDDLRGALDEHDLWETWDSLTPMARWEWVRWIGATRNEATRAKRVDVTASKMLDGKRRPCCFDLSSCTDPELARSGKLIPAS